MELVVRRNRDVGMLMLNYNKHGTNRDEVTGAVVITGDQIWATCHLIRR